MFYIDADCLVMENPESIFELQDVEFAAAPDVFPPDCFNAGVMLIKPSLEKFNMLVEKIPKVKSYDGGDTGFLNSIFRHKWWEGPYKRLEYTWNC